MEETPVIDVRVVETKSNYVEAAKLAIIAGVFGVIATQTTNALLGSVTEKAKKRKLDKLIEEQNNSTTPES